MSRKHNTRHRRSRSNYPNRLADRGLSRTPTMTWTGWTTAQIQAAFDKLPRYKWAVVDEYNENGIVVGKRQTRRQIGG